MSWNNLNKLGEFSRNFKRDLEQLFTYFSKLLWAIKMYWCIKIKLLNIQSTLQNAYYYYTTTTTTTTIIIATTLATTNDDDNDNKTIIIAIIITIIVIMIMIKQQFFF